MKTYLILWFSSEGAEPRVVIEKLLSIGFKPVRGYYDLAYDWGKEATMEEVLMLSNAIRETIRGSNVMYKMETV